MSTVVSSRDRRTRARNKVRAKIAQEERMKHIAESCCKPLNIELINQGKRVQDINDQFSSKESELRGEVQKTVERVLAFETNLVATVKAEVERALVPHRKFQDERMINMDIKVNENTRLLGKVNYELPKSFASMKSEFETFASHESIRLESLEKAAKEQREAKRKLDKLHDDYTEYVKQQVDRDARTHVLEAMMKDMEGRLWPWRPNMDRSPSPPRDGTEWKEWANHWPRYGPVKPENKFAMKALKRTAAMSPMTPPTPSPPESRPNSRPTSAVYRESESTPVKGGGSTAPFTPTPPDSKTTPRPSSAPSRPRGRETTLAAAR